MTNGNESAARNEGSTPVSVLDDAQDATFVSGLELRALASNAAVRRGLITLIAGLVVLAWPSATGSVIVAIVAVGLALGGLSDLVAAIRGGSAWVGLSKSLILIAAGGSILIFGETSLRLIALGLGLMLVGRGLIDLVVLARRWSDTSERLWLVIRGTGQVVIGGAVAGSPTSVLFVAITALAVAWVFAGLLNIAAAVQADGDDSDDRGAVVTTVDWLRSRDMGTANRQFVVDKLIFEGPARRTRLLRFVALMMFATAIATFGVQADSTAVVIGAMLIAPLMTPIMATSASLLMGWPVRALRSLALVVLGVVLAIGTSWILTKYAPDIVAIETNSQIASRVAPTLLDLLVAVAAGAAGAYATSRADVSDSLPGVAIAVALVPPLTVVGVSLNASAYSFAAGAFLLFLTNLVGIVLSAGLVLVLVGFSPWFHLEAKREQVLRSFAAAAIALVVIAVPLAFTGGQIVTAAVDERAVATTVDDWLGEADFFVAEVVVDGGTVVVALVGGDDPPQAEDLAVALARKLDRVIDLDLRVIPEERVRTTARP